MNFPRTRHLFIAGFAGVLFAAAANAQEAATVTPAPEPAPTVTAELTDQQPAHAGDAAAGQTKAAACAACHGMDGNSSDPQYPKIAGQHERYIARQLTMFKNGERENPIMMGFASTLSPQDMRDIGAYFASQKVMPGVADDSAMKDGPMSGEAFYKLGQRIFRGGNAKAGVPACIACHGPSGAGNPGAQWPAIGGQHAAYTSAKLTAFRDGQSWGKDGSANDIMKTVAAGLSDQDIQALATYLEGLHDVANQASPEAVAAAKKSADDAAAKAASDAANEATPAESAEATPAAPQG